MMRLCNLDMGVGMDIIHAGVNVHVCINVYQEFLLYSNPHHLVRPSERPLLLLHLG